SYSRASSFLRIWVPDRHHIKEPGQVFPEPEETAGVRPTVMRVYRGRYFQESWMQRIAGFLLLAWLATSAAAQGQIVSQSTSPNGTTSATSTSATATFDATTVNGASLPGTPCSVSGGSFIGSLSMALGCG